MHLLGPSLTEFVRCAGKGENLSLKAERIFCLNSGNCGSKYIVELLKANGVDHCYHEKPPDLDEEGVRYYLDGGRKAYLRSILFLTRKSVYFESSNRLFSLASLIQDVFPNAKFIHLHRDGRDVVNSTMNKMIWPDWIMNSPRLRYASELAGPKDLSPFERTCLYWANYNERILNDLRGKNSISVRFEEMINGNVGSIEKFINRDLETEVIEPVNTKEDIKLDKNRYDNWSAWPSKYKNTFEMLCGSTMERLGYC